MIPLKQEEAAWGQSSFRDTLQTVDKEGKRVWLYPKQPKGKWYRRRGIVGYSLLAFLISAPFIRIRGHQMLQFDFLNRKFVLFGQVFWPHDFYIFLIALVAILVFIVMFTAIFGRVWCGWTCPQTIFMEMVFRRIEYWIEGEPGKQKKLDKMPWNFEKIMRRGGKHVIFYGLSFFIANIFLSYIIGVDALKKIVTEPPLMHIGGLITIAGFSGAFYFVYAYFREQVCTVVCPYGRLQGVMVDQRSMIVAYDYKRGEPKQRWGKKRTENAGDCIDCKQCVSVCPTGIDIRNGIQLECVSCTACIDACDSVMTKIGKPKGLIRFASEEGIEKGEKFRMTPRRIAYSALSGLLIVVLVVILALRSDVQATILRTPGVSYIEEQKGVIANIYNFKVLNKTFEDMPVELRLEGIKGNISYTGNGILAPSDDYGEGVIKVEIPQQNLANGSTPITIGVYAKGKRVETVNTNFLGPEI